MRVLLFLLLALLAEASHAERVTLAQGTLTGERVDGISRFLGVPFALPPVGELRWRPPLPVPAGGQEVDATGFSAACLQTPSKYVGAPAGYSEDCLSLNIWSPALDGELPVMVWIHGGGFRAGSNVFPGEVLAAHDVVVVAINYRLGPLGFFAHEALHSAVANFGLLDMELALRWVQDNIGRIGGDRDRVTIFGLSGGAQAVNLLMASPRTAGLFQRAIAQSGYATWTLPRTSWAPAASPLGADGGAAPSAEAIAEQIVGKVQPEARDAASLRALDGMALVSAVEGFHLPVVDGTSLPEEPGIVFRRGQQRQVPLISGGNSFDGSVLPASGISEAAVRTSLAGDAERARSLYASDSEELWLVRLFGDYRYVLSARVLGESMARVASPSWLYYLDFLEAGQEERPGTRHGMDGAYLLGGDTHDDPKVRELSRQLRGYWTNFARSGDPNGPGLPPWPRYDPEADRWLVFGSDGTTARERVIADRLDLLESLYNRRAAPALD